MHPSSRLRVQFDPDSLEALFSLVFAAPAPNSGTTCARATLDPGDGRAIELGDLCSPTADAWRTAREITLANHRFSTSDRRTAILRWGDQRLTAEVGENAAAADIFGIDLPELSLFEMRALRDNPFAAMLVIQIANLQSGQRIRVDGGAGQIYWPEASNGELSASIAVEYAKAGDYTVAIDLLDDTGFWIGALGESTFSVEAPADEATGPAAQTAHQAEVQLETPTLEMDTEVPVSSSSTILWLPFRYARPNWAWTRTYQYPGGRVSRSLAPGTYLAIRQEAAYDGNLWYQAGQYDWIPSTSVTLLEPSALRGIALATDRPDPEPEPEPEPEPRPEPPVELRYGVVTANVLNVRKQPGVYTSNPPVDKLRYNMRVTIFAEDFYAGAPWYRIGADRWVHSGYIRLVPALAATMMLADPDPSGGLSPTLPIGWVAAPSLNVRSSPGAQTDATIIGEIYHNEAVNILEAQSVRGQTWYRIGADRWVYGKWIGVATPKSRPSRIAEDVKWVGVCLKEQTAIAYEGDRPVYAALVATGLPGTPTVQGVFRTWWRVDSRRMTGGSGAGYYFLEEVTWTCYFYGGYALHTAYWHDAFGRPRSHGCVNLSPYDAWWLYQWSASGGDKSPMVYVYWS